MYMSSYFAILSLREIHCLQIGVLLTTCQQFLRCYMMSYLMYYCADSKQSYITLQRVFNLSIGLNQLLQSLAIVVHLHMERV